MKTEKRTYAIPAVTLERFELHTVAMEVSRSLPGRKNITTQVTITEFLNYFAAFGEQFRQHAVEAIRAMQQDPRVELVPRTPRRRGDQTMMLR